MEITERSNQSLTASTRSDLAVIGDEMGVDDLEGIIQRLAMYYAYDVDSLHVGARSGRIKHRKGMDDE